MGLGFYTLKLWGVSPWGREHDLGVGTLFSWDSPWGVHQLTCHLNWHPPKGYRLCFLFLSDCFQDFFFFFVFSSQKFNYGVSLHGFLWVYLIWNSLMKLVCIFHHICEVLSFLLWITHWPYSLPFEVLGPIVLSHGFLRLWSFSETQAPTQISSFNKNWPSRFSSQVLDYHSSLAPMTT